jgi:sterol 14alpha-demethylase
MPLPTPPEVPGLPLLGNTVAFARDRRKLIREAYERLGPIFSLRFGPKKAVVLLGPEYNKFFFTETDKKLSMDKALEFQRAMYPGNVMFYAGVENYRDQRPIVAAPLQSARMDSHVRVMQLEVDEWLNSLGDEGTFELVEHATRLSQTVVSHSIMGREFRDHISGNWHLFPDLAGGLDPILPHYLPLPKFIRRDRAKHKLTELIGQILRKRQAEPGQHADFLQDFINAKYRDGRQMPDDDIIGVIMAMMIAGYETTVGHVSWSLILLLQNPDYLRLVLADQDSLLDPKEPLELGKLRQLNRLDWSLKETERLHPSVGILVRYALEDCEVGGYRIPKGWLAFVSPEISHRLPNIWTNPEQYDPLRFSPGREEDRVPMTMIGFGGGVHRCTGLHFAYNFTKVALTRMLQRFDLELVTREPRDLIGMQISRPDACIIRYKRRAARNAPVEYPPEAVAACPFLRSKAEGN